MDKNYILTYRCNIVLQISVGMAAKDEDEAKKAAFEILRTHQFDWKKDGQLIEVHPYLETIVLDKGENSDGQD